MAQRNINGKDILLFIDPLGGTAYDTMVCLTSNGLVRNTAVETATSKCGVDSAPGEKTITIPFAGTIVFEPATGKTSSGDLHSLWEGDTTIGWQIGPATPVTGDVLYEGTGWISDLTETYDATGRATYTGTINVIGTVTQTVTV